MVLHGAEAGERSYFLYEHLAQLMGEEGVAVLRYDRRPAAAGDDVPLQTQAQDSLASLRMLREVIGPVPAGLWGYSQGAWAAALAATMQPVLVQFLVCVSFSGVSPAVQMRVGCANQLRKHGFDEHAVTELTATRRVCEHYLRTGEDGEQARQLLNIAVGRPWFPHAYLPPSLPEPGSWPDMDFDPGAILARLSCPVLAFYGETDEWMPIDESVSAWRSAQDRGAPIDLSIVRLPGADHLPTRGGQPSPEAISTLYAETLAGWVPSVCGG